jgi:hypothetical protein
LAIGLLPDVIGGKSPNIVYFNRFSGRPQCSK